MSQLFNQLSDWMSNGDNLVPALFLALILYIVSRFILEHFNHKADRREQRYRRASETGNKRFESELDHLEMISSVLLQLVAATEAVTRQDAPNWCSYQERKEWLAAHNAAVKALGSGAPLLNYIDLKSGLMSCGVQVGDSLDVNKDVSKLKGYENLPEYMKKSQRRSLYMRCALLIDACTLEVQDAIGVPVGRLVDECIFTADKDSRRAKDPKGREGATVNGDDGEQVLQTEDGRGQTKGQKDLFKEYHKFLNCAYCRLRDSESGTYDARRKRVKKWRTEWLRSLFPGVYGYFDAECVFDNGGSESGCESCDKEDCDQSCEAESPTSDNRKRCNINTGSAQNGLLNSLERPEAARLIAVIALAAFLAVWVVVQFIGAGNAWGFLSSVPVYVPLVFAGVCTLVIFLAWLASHYGSKAGKADEAEAKEKSDTNNSNGTETKRKGPKYRYTRTVEMILALSISVAVAFLIAFFAPSWPCSNDPVVRQAVNDYSWEELSSISQKIAQAPDDESAIEIAKQYHLCTEDGKLNGKQLKDLELIDDTIAQVQIAGFRHDEKTDGGKAGITFIFKDAITKGSMISSGSENEGWANSDLRSWLASDGMARLPENLRNSLVMVNKYTKDSNSEEDSKDSKKDESKASGLITCDKLWLYSTTELYGVTQLSDGGYGYAPTFGEYGYQLFRDMGTNGGEPNEILVKNLDDQPCYWWERTADSGSGSFMVVSEKGSSDSGKSADESLGVVPGFCI